MCVGACVRVCVRMCVIVTTMHNKLQVPRKRNEPVTVGKRIVRKMNNNLMLHMNTERPPLSYRQQSNVAPLDGY